MKADGDFYDAHILPFAQEQLQTDLVASNIGIDLDQFLPGNCEKARKGIVYAG